MQTLIWSYISLKYKQILRLFALSSRQILPYYFPFNLKTHNDEYYFFWKVIVPQIIFRYLKRAVWHKISTEIPYFTTRTAIQPRRSKTPRFIARSACESGCRQQLCVKFVCIGQFNSHFILRWRYFIIKKESSGGI